jgi:predicted HTH transcriptional regulator
MIFMPPPVVFPLEKLGIFSDGRFDQEKLFETIQQVETDMVEFKATCRDYRRNQKIDRGMIAQEMAALANTRGGLLVFGIPDKSKPDDIEIAREMREELGASGKKQMGKEWGQKYILDIIAGVAKGSGRDANACWPAVTYVPYVFDAEDIGLEKEREKDEGRVLVIAVFPLDEDRLCFVNQHVYVRVGTSCRKADDPWVEEWYRSKKKMWL